MSNIAYLYAGAVGATASILVSLLFRQQAIFLKNRKTLQTLQEAANQTNRDSCVLKLALRKLDEEGDTALRKWCEKVALGAEDARTALTLELIVQDPTGRSYVVIGGEPITHTK